MQFFKTKGREFTLSWKQLIVLSLVFGIVPALLNILPVFKDTSLQDIAHNLEIWVFAAVGISLYCKTPQKSAQKIFIFFLISQPLFYLIEVPVYGWQIFENYPYWFV